MTEYCQGPCHENQNSIAHYDSNGLDIIAALLVTDIKPLTQRRMDLVLELKNNTSKLLLAIMASRSDGENTERILCNLNPHLSLVRPFTKRRLISAPSMAVMMNRSIRVRLVITFIFCVTSSWLDTTRNCPSS
jgi:hypothetical protein